ncbi:MAG: hypothetical protein NTX50_23020 [Candidatus Sumerlaeota bacterium]|nr:hypothetical protein [Candidatus Sumerlaeota bacterium]
MPDYSSTHTLTKSSSKRPSRAKPNPKTIARRAPQSKDRSPATPAAPSAFVNSSQLESITGWWPEYLADCVVEEVEHHFREFLPECLSYRLVEMLSQRAKYLFEVNDQYRRRISGRNGRKWLLVFYRHWLSSYLAKSKPTLALRLPDSFKIGRPLASCGPIIGNQLCACDERTI